MKKTFLQVGIPGGGLRQPITSVWNAMKSCSHRRSDKEICERYKSIKCMFLITFLSNSVCITNSRLQRYITQKLPPISHYLLLLMIFAKSSCKYLKCCPAIKVIVSLNFESIYKNPIFYPKSWVSCNFLPRATINNLSDKCVSTNNSRLFRSSEWRLSVKDNQVEIISNR